MVGVIDGFRWAILNTEVNLHPVGFPLSLMVVGLLFVTGLNYFRKTERTFADVI
jgi:lipopolysaccharide transport system permease protein